MTEQQIISDVIIRNIGYHLPIIGWTLVLTMLTGTAVYGIWYLLCKGKMLHADIRVMRSLLWLVIVSWCVPLLAAVWWIKEPMYKHRYEIFTASRLIQDALKMILAVWAAGSFIQAGSFIREIQKNTKLRKESVLCGGKEDILCRQLCRQLKIRSKIRVYRNTDIVSPMSSGIFRQSIFLPMTEMKPEILRVVIAHELIHIRNYDHTMRLMLILTGCLHWYHPAAKQLFWDANEWNEYYCDRMCCRFLRMGAKEYFAVIRECMADIREQKKSTRLQANLFKKKYTLKKREDIITMTEKNHEAKWWKRMLLSSGVMVSAFVMSYTVSFAAVVGYDRLMHLTTAEVVEEAQERGQTAMQEVIEYAEDAPETIRVYEGILDNPLMRIVETKSWELEPGVMVSYGYVYMEAGESVTLSVLADGNVDFGIIDSDATKRYVIGMDLSHVFNIEKTDRYRFFVRNRSDETISGALNIRR